MNVDQMFKLFEQALREDIQISRYFNIIILWRNTTAGNL